MAEVYVDDAPEMLAPMPGTWGDLLAILDDRVSSRDLLVTAVRLDGVDDPSFRAPAAAARPLAPIRRVDVATVAPRRLFAQCCGDAAGSVVRMAASAETLASRFRLRDGRAAEAGLGQLAGDLRDFVTLLQAMLRSPGFAPEWLAVDGVPVEAQIVRFVGWIDTLVETRARKDWAALATVLQHDIAPALRRWEQTLGDTAAAPRTAAVTPAVLTRNLDTLAATAAGIPDLSAARPDLVRVELSPFGPVALMRRTDGGWARLHGDADPVAEAERSLETVFRAGTPQALVCIGIGLGYVLDALERRRWPGTVIAVEPEPATVTAMLARRDWHKWITGGRLRILTAPDYVGAADCWRWFGDGTTRPPVLVNGALARLREADVAQARAVVDRIQFDARSNADARRKFAPTYLLNTLRNLRVLADEGDAAALDGAGQGVPAVVVAAGPSLDAALPALRAIQDRAFIVAVDTALLPLAIAGIEPHLVVAVDPGEANVRHLVELPACSGTHLVAEASVHPLAMRSFEGRTFLYTLSDHQPWPWLRAQKRDAGRLRVWGSVLTPAFDLALRMGCDPIAFVGADLAYTNNRPYARGVVYEDDWRRRAAWGTPREAQWAAVVAGSPEKTVPDVQGQPARSAPRLVGFRDWLVEQMRRETGRRFINATGAGILVGGAIEQVTPDRLVDLLPPPQTDLRALVQSRHRSGDGARLLNAARTLRRKASSGARSATTVLTSWEAFATGLDRNSLLAALDAGLAPRDTGSAVSVATSGATVHTDVFVEVDALPVLAASIPLAEMALLPDRFEPAGGGTWTMAFRTAAGRVIGSTILAGPDALSEDGRPLRLVDSATALVPGTYAIVRGVLHVRLTDASDPRTNGRAYSLRVPACVASVEQDPA